MLPIRYALRRWWPCQKRLPEMIVVGPIANRLLLGVILLRRCSDVVCKFPSRPLMNVLRPTGWTGLFTERVVTGGSLPMAASLPWRWTVVDRGLGRPRRL